MEKLEKALNLYEDTFDDSFPMFPMKGKKPDEIIEIINECVSKKKDVYELKYLTLDEDVLY
jgi:hypothetical protein